ncbi:polarity establishment/cellular polarization [Exophiala xenobiotica]|uniref:Polarity establishment/cellular polarization n=1 Tax=Vermiconidia calcicola TaxID=1690605 RepID=A0AAV9QGU8_9PEZI|nr:polarity establishment/cellular polarization [Exophiala xenobiotica]KAK5539185.1 polarity establishment/cellular polarization [Chaetothyriales sp. CCFEE 6169]KAK5542543.1 polarity establishment/cellular polarization [Vermiconidia calcicola]KAK5195593.1 polarity establishment/cellular polarization [Exophiala xenobiotica]KAK5226102.1 polarity establishment/cellular polarization [Exophiala xenobiotica]
MTCVERKPPTLALILALLAASAVAVPDLGFPINSQVPPVAYVSEPYNFEFAATTFVSSDPPISYNITDGPGWLQLDSLNRLLTGTPLQEDIGAHTFQLTALDTTGEASTTVTLIVLESTKLRWDAPVLPQMQQVGPCSSPDSLLLHPLQPFELAFSQDTFSGTDHSTTYEAVSDDHSPLPSWIHFDPSGLLFKGTSPPLVSPALVPQTYGFLLIATNVPGFAEVAVHFHIVVGYNVLAFSDVSQDVNISTGVPVRTPPLRSSLRINGEAIANGQIASVIINGPAWLQVDKSQISLSGTPPTAVDLDVTIRVMDIYDDVANTTISLHAEPLLATSLGKIATIDITPGEDFSYTVNETAFTGDGRISADLSNAPTWLRFDDNRRTLSGTPPLDLPRETITTPINFENATANVTGFVDIQRATITTATSTETLQTTGMPHASQTSIPYNTSVATTHNTKRPVTVIILAIVFAAFGVLLIICVILLLMRRRQRKKKAAEDQAVILDGSPESGRHRPHPILPTPLSPNTGPPVASPRKPPVRPPRVDLTWTNNSSEMGRLSGIAQAQQPRYSRASPGGGPSNEEHDLSKRELAEGSSIIDGFTKKAARSSRQASHKSVVKDFAVDCNLENRESFTTEQQRDRQSVVGLPNRRSGAGHGAGILVHSHADADHRFSRNSRASNPHTESRRTTVVLDSFPTPPDDKSRSGKAVVLLERSPNPSQPAVSEDVNQSMSFEARRQQWHTERARARLEGTARFSNAGASHMLALPQERTGKAITNRHSRPFTLLRHNENVGSPTSREPSWSKWSGVGPAAHDSLRAASPLDSLIANLPNPRADTSIRSSGQFESAASSESHWEDEDLHLPASPRAPFKVVLNSRCSTTSDKVVTHPREGEVSDARRKHISVADGGLVRAQGSHHGSFRFI